MKNLLLAVNLDANDSPLLNIGFLMSSKFNAKLWMIHVAAPNPDFVGYDIGPTYLREVRADELREEHQLLQTYLLKMLEDGISAEALLIQGPTVEMLQAEIEKLEIDLVILGYQPHNWLYKTLVGHTSIKLLKHLEIPLMIMPFSNEE